MKGYNGRFFYCLLIALIGYALNNLKISGILISIIYLVNIIVVSKDYIAFREYVMGIYSINFLLVPSIMFEYNGVDYLAYTMKGDQEYYFLNSIIGILSLHLGMYLYKAKVFQNTFKLAKIQGQLNEKVLRTWTIAGFIIGFITSKVPLPQELIFFCILLSGLRFVGVFGLISLDFKKYKYEILFIFGYELFTSVSWGFFHDVLVWFIFLGLYVVYLNKYSLATKIVSFVIFVFLAYLLQNIKGEYRNAIWTTGYEDNELQSFSKIAKAKTEQADFFSEEKVVQTLVRINQGWIFASTMDRMDKVQDFAGTELIYKYLEAAFLPRFLAPDKLQAGDKVIFNKYSGHRIAENTSMALGIFADGYVSNGTTGVLLFGFGLGLAFSLVFFVVDKWSGISPFFSLMLFPILYYTVRPDCETQVTLGQIVKGIFVYWLVIRYYKTYFKKQTIVIQRIEALIEAKKQEILNKRNLQNAQNI